MTWHGNPIPALLHLFYPHLCPGCRLELKFPADRICPRCIAHLPCTDFAAHTDNPVERLFRGRLPIEYATAQFYFSRHSVVQQLIHRLKYRGDKSIGLLLGQMMGQDLARCGIADRIDAVIPMPLFRSRQKKRGYNQAEIIAKGVASATGLRVSADAIRRRSATETQTRKGRFSRWQNIEGQFELTTAASLCGLHVLLIDDVITTGATMEACARALLSVERIKISIAALCYATR